MTGKNRRLKRIFVGPNQRCVLLPFDHGPWLGPVPGIDSPRDITQKVLSGGANALLMTPGFLREVEPLIKPDTGIVLRVSLSAGLSEEAVQEVPSMTLKTALRVDADAVAVSIFFGRGKEPDIMRWLGMLIEECTMYNVPVIAEMMPPFDKFYEAEAIAHAARIGMELGADIIKTNYSGDIDTFRQVVTAVPVPIIVAGGPKKGEDDSAAQVATDAIKAGARGIAFGRRVWQSKDPEGLVKQLAAVVHNTEVSYG